MKNDSFELSILDADYIAMDPIIERNRRAATYIQRCDRRWARRRRRTIRAIRRLQGGLQVAAVWAALVAIAVLTGASLGLR